MKKTIRQVVRTRTAAIAVALTMIVMTFLSGCASPGSLSKPSRTDRAFEGITEESGMHLCTELDDENGPIRLDMYRKADNLYIDMLQDGNQTILISNGKVLTVLDPVKKEMSEVEITEEIQAQLDQIVAQQLFCLDGELEMGKLENNFVMHKNARQILITRE